MPSRNYRPHFRDDPANQAAAIAGREMIEATRQKAAAQGIEIKPLGVEVATFDDDEEIERQISQAIPTRIITENGNEHVLVCEVQDISALSVETKNDIQRQTGKDAIKFFKALASAEKQAVEAAPAVGVDVGWTPPTEQPVLPNVSPITEPVFNIPASPAFPPPGTPPVEQIPTWMLEMLKRSQQPAAPVPPAPSAGPPVESLGLPWLDAKGAAGKPKQVVHFLFPQMEAEARFHAVVFFEEGMVLVYDNRYEDGVQFFPTPSSTPIEVRIPIGSPPSIELKKLRALPTPIRFTLGKLEFGVLLTEPEQPKPQPEDPYGETRSSRPDMDS